MKQRKSLLSLLLVLVMMAMSTTQVCADDLTPLTDAQCSKLRLGPSYIGYYAISNADELAWFRDFVNTSVETSGSTTYPNIKANGVLIADIDLSTLTGNWTPIGTESGPFMGKFDGRGHSIKGLSILNYTTSNQGLFGHVKGEYVSDSSEKHAVLKNFSVSGTMTSATSGLNHIGGVVGYSNYCVDLTDVTNYVNITLTAGTTQSHIGGVAGWCSRTVMLRCANNGNINAGASYDCVGGLQGYTTGYSSMQYCLNTGSITSSADNAYIGGILGYHNDGKDDHRFKGCHYCLNTGTVKGGTADTYAGAIIGRYRQTANEKSTNNYYLSTSSTKAVGADETEDNVANACTAVSAAQIASGEACTKVAFHTYAANDRNHEQCTFCHHYFFHYSTTDNKAVTPNKPENILDADGNSFITNKYLAGESMYAMEFKAPLVTIGEKAFYECKSLSGTLTIPSTVTSIGNSAFFQCENLTDSLTIPNSVTSIGKSAFAYCSKLILVTLPNSITSIEPGIFYSCTKLEGDLTIPNTVTSIGDNAFSSCHNFNGTLTLSDNIITIGKESFCTCHFQGTLNIPSTVTNIGESAFGNCTWFTSIAMNSIPMAKNGIFSGCTSNISLTLTDDSYVTTATGNYFPEVTSATYTRTGIKNKWGTIVLPFDVTIDNNAPYDFYTISEVTSTAITLTKMSGTLDAGTPALFCMTETAKNSSGYNDLVITNQGSNVTVGTNINNITVYGLTLTGSFAAKELTETAGYIIANNKFWRISDLREHGTVFNSPFRAYLEGSVAGAKSLSIVFDDDATAIKAISELSAEEGWGEVYDLNGRRLNDLQKGVNIVKRDGKTYKIIVK